jgi:hypothetical protein
MLFPNLEQREDSMELLIPSTTTWRAMINQTPILIYDDLAFNHVISDYRKDFFLMIRGSALLRSISIGVWLIIALHVVVDGIRSSIESSLCSRFGNNMINS